MMESTAIDFSQILTWVGSLTTAFTTMFTALAAIWVLYVPMALGVFGKIFGKIRSLTWNKSGKKRR